MDELEKMGLRPVELKPCPFCGGHAEISEDHCRPSDKARWFIKCYTCGGSLGFYRDPYETAAKWNRRGGEPLWIKC
jgi:Lar family restriction alleviation protein